MKVFKIDITAWTSSFKYPNLISGFQPTLDVPPISTILGLVNAASGRYIKHRKLKIGYYFEYSSKQIDLESIYQIGGHEKGYPKSTVNSNIVNREFLFDSHLIIYLEDETIANYFNQPAFPILLGRSNDLATVNSIDRVDLTEISNASKIKGQIVPLFGNFLPGMVQALPKYFSDTIPRKNWGTEPYSILSYNAEDVNTNLTAYVDYLKNNNEKEIHIYFHELDFDSYYE